MKQALNQVIKHGRRVSTYRQTNLESCGNVTSNKCWSNDKAKLDRKSHILSLHPTNNQNITKLLVVDVICT